MYVTLGVMAPSLCARGAGSLDLGQSPLRAMRPRPRTGPGGRDPSGLPRRRCSYIWTTAERRGARRIPPVRCR